MQLFLWLKAPQLFTANFGVAAGTPTTAWTMCGSVVGLSGSNVIRAGAREVEEGGNNDGARTENRTQHRSDGRRISDAAGVAALHDHACWAGATGAADFAAGRWGAHLPYRHAGGDQSTLCL